MPCPLSGDCVQEITMNNTPRKLQRYTDKEIEQIKKWRAEGQTWAEISDRNGRSADAMMVKFSSLSRGIPEYKEQEIPKIVIPDNVQSINDRKEKLTIKSRVPHSYAVQIELPLKTFDTLEEAAGFVNELKNAVGCEGKTTIFELNEIEI